MSDVVKDFGRLAKRAPDGGPLAGFADRQAKRRADAARRHPDGIGENGPDGMRGHDLRNRSSDMKRKPKYVMDVVTVAGKTETLVTQVDGGERVTVRAEPSFVKGLLARRSKRATKRATKRAAPVIQEDAAARFRRLNHLPDTSAAALAAPAVTAPDRKSAEDGDAVFRRLNHMPPRV